MAGRPKGSKTRYSISLQRQMLRSGNLTPLEYLVSVYTNDSNSLRDRLDAAKAAAPYVHPRLSAIEVSNGTLNRDARSISNEELIAIINGKSEHRGCNDSCMSDSQLELVESLNITSSVWPFSAD